MATPVSLSSRSTSKELRKSLRSTTSRLRNATSLLVSRPVRRPAARASATRATALGPHGQPGRGLEHRPGHLRPAQGPAEQGADLGRPPVEVAGGGQLAGPDRAPQRVGGRVERAPPGQGPWRPAVAGLELLQQLPRGGEQDPAHVEQDPLAVGTRHSAGPGLAGCAGPAQVGEHPVHGRGPRGDDGLAGPAAPHRLRPGLEQPQLAPARRSFPVRPAARPPTRRPGARPAPARRACPGWPARPPRRRPGTAAPGRRPAPRPGRPARRPGRTGRRPPSRRPSGSAAPG